MSKVKELIESENTHAFPLMKAMSKALGNFISWEPESIWLELEAQGIKIPEINKSKIGASLALELVPSFYWDALVFENTALVFNNVLPNPETLHEAHPEHLAWAVIEASLLRGSENSIDFLSEPQKYCAVVLHRSGFTLAPEELAFCQESLDLINLNKDSKKDVEQIWKVLPRKKLAEIEFAENEKEVQLGRLAMVHIYVEEQRDKCNKQLADLDGNEITSQKTSSASRS